MTENMEGRPEQQLEEDEVIEIKANDVADKSHSADSKQSSSSKNQEAEVIGSPSSDKELVDMAFSPLDKKHSAQSQGPHERSFEQIIVMDSPNKSPEKKQPQEEEENRGSEVKQTQIQLTPQKQDAVTEREMSEQVLSNHETQKYQDKEQRDSQIDIQPSSPVANPKQTMVSDSTRAASDKYYLPIHDKNIEEQPLVDDHTHALNVSAVNADDQQSILLSETGSEKRKRLLQSGPTSRIQEEPLIESRRCYCYPF